MEMKVGTISSPLVRWSLLLKSSFLTAAIEASRWVAIAGKLFASIAFAAAYQYTAELYPTVVRYQYLETYL